MNLQKLLIEILIKLLIIYICKKNLYTIYYLFLYTIFFFCFTLIFIRNIYNKFITSLDEVGENEINDFKAQSSFKIKADFISEEEGLVQTVLSESLEFKSDVKNFFQLCIKSNFNLIHRFQYL